jgi:hypothetical protein
MVVAVTTIRIATNYHRLTTMPDIIPHSEPPLRPAPPIDAFFARVIRSVHRKEARSCPPYCYSLSATAGFTGLPVRPLRRLCRDGILDAIKPFGWWMVHRDEFMRLLSLTCG